MLIREVPLFCGPFYVFFTVALIHAPMYPLPSHSDSPADDAPILPVVEQKHDEGSEFWGEFTDTKSLAQVP